MSVDPTSFRQALGRFASGVTVVTTRDARGRASALTVSAFCSVSLEPPLVLVCIERSARIDCGLRESGIFAVSVLREEQEDVSRHFAGREPDERVEFALMEARSGAPFVRGALAHLQCRVRSSHEEGDHTVWIGEVVASAVHPGRPLLYFRGRYRSLEPE